MSRPIAQTVLLSAAVLLLWFFPRVWYTRAGGSSSTASFSERTAIDGWSYRPIPVAESAERVLVADQIVSGEFGRPDGATVRVFSAKRFQEKSSEIGLFVHTPDRCWTEAGWKLMPANPALVRVEVNGLAVPFERRLFVSGNHTELVYFAGIVGGQPLPYRLDHNLSVGQRYNQAHSGGTRLRASDRLLWQRVWESFVSHRPLLGPKQFIRISTPLAAGPNLEEADLLLQTVLKQWLAL